MRWIGLKTGHYPEDPVVSFENDRICEDWNDLIAPMGGVYFAKDQDRIDKCKAAFEKLEKFVESLEPFLKQKN